MYFRESFAGRQTENEQIFNKKLRLDKIYLR